METTSRKRVTIKDIAALAGVGKATVSYVLNSTQTKVAISEETRKRVLQVVKEYGYHPNAAAKALITKRTGYIGFILSDTVPDGWRNDFYAAHFAGVERACHAKRYGLVASLYNLSDISSFVFPSGVGQRSVDGVVLTGYVQKEVANEFKKFGLPCVCIGDDLEVADMIPSVSPKVVEGRFEAVKYLAELGHVRIAFPHHASPRTEQVFELLVEMMKTDPVTRNCRLECIGPVSSMGDRRDVVPVLQEWLGRPSRERPTAIIHTDQVTIGLEREMFRHGLICPRDLSLLSFCETRLCENGIPGITSIDFDFEQIAEAAAQMLIDHLVGGTAIDSRYYYHFPGKLLIRESCGKPPVAGT